ncbi:MAG: anthranilate synthase component I family protein [Flavipsychrobacter sp.]
MQREKKTYTIAKGQLEDVKLRMLNWASQFSIFMYLDSNNYTEKYMQYHCLAGIGCTTFLDTTDADALDKIHAWHNENKDWLFGNINYDYKNTLEPKLHSAKEKRIDFPEVYFFNPTVVCSINLGKNQLAIESYDITPDEVYNAMMHLPPMNDTPLPKVTFKQRVEKEHYLQTINRLKQHIADGDCYEINYCTESYAEKVSLTPRTAFKALNNISPAPFSAFYRYKDSYMMCASPERYLQKEGAKVIAQPIKGTAPRGFDEQRDEEIMAALAESIKDRAENVMIVDLMRNDLARSCKVGSVQVDELFGIYTFPQVHQMISTVSGELKDDVPFTDAIKYSFPMGSMTGAPKIKVMELIEQYEQSRRELFSGTVGYISPDGDFDFNVIIRSLFYNAETQYLSFQAGGAITYDSMPEKEYEEMQLKSWAMAQIFQ